MAEQNYRIKIKIGDYKYEVEGDKEFVEKYYTQIKGDFSFDKLEEKKSRELSKQKNMPGKKKRITLTDFYKNSKPQNHNEKIILFAYWLLENKDIEEFQSSRDIMSCYDTIKIKKPVNIHQHIANLKKEGLIMEGSNTNNYKLTLHGIEYAKSKLPIKKEELYNN